MTRGDLAGTWNPASALAFAPLVQKAAVWDLCYLLSCRLVQDFALAHGFPSLITELASHAAMKVVLLTV